MKEERKKKKENWERRGDVIWYTMDLLFHVLYCTYGVLTWHAMPVRKYGL
jgi:hypothetical protein